MPEDSSRVTLRDVFDVVAEAKQQISALDSKVDEFVTSNEHRLTVVETHQAAQALRLNDVDIRLDKHGEAIGDLKDQQKAEKATVGALETRRRQSSSARRWVVDCALALGVVMATWHPWH